MNLQPGKWYYFEILGDRNYLYTSDENNDVYFVTHYFKKTKGKIERDKGTSYVNKGSNSLRSYREISKRGLIREIW